VLTEPLCEERYNSNNSKYNNNIYAFCQSMVPINARIIALRNCEEGDWDCFKTKYVEEWEWLKEDCKDQWHAALGRELDEYLASLPVLNSKWACRAIELCGRPFLTADIFHTNQSSNAFSQKTRLLALPFSQAV